MANPLESQLNYPFGDSLPETGHTLAVAPGVRWLRMPLPFALDHINLWLLEDEMTVGQQIVRGWTIIDCGIDSPETRSAWELIFRQELKGLPVLRVIATHCHPDHVGLAHWLCERWNVPLWMTAGEYAIGRLLSAAMPGADGDAMLAHFRAHGVSDAAMLESIAKRKNHYPHLAPAMPSSLRRLHDGTSLPIGGRQWEIMVGLGHSPEHASLYCDELKVLVSGDMVLPRISTNVSVIPLEPESNPVQLYLDSLTQYETLDEDTLVLPSHGKPFRGLHARIAQLRSHHAQRLEEVMNACVAARSATEIVPLMFPRALDSHQLTFALGEALAHLHKLWFDGALERTLEADGVFRFMQLTVEETT